MKLKLLWIIPLGFMIAFSGCDKSDADSASITTEVDSSQDSSLDFAFLATSTFTHSGAATPDDTHKPSHDQSGRQHHITEVAITDLPATITAYVSNHFAHATIERAGKANNGEYILQVKKANGISVGLLFDASSNFISEKNHHDAHGTAVAVNHLPATVTTYISAHYAGATIEKASKDTHGHLFALIKKADATLAGLAFDATGKFINEVTIKGELSGHNKGHH